MEEQIVINLWEKIGNRCLDMAYGMLTGNAAPIAETVEAVRGLVAIAIDIDQHEHLWVTANQRIPVDRISKGLADALEKARTESR